MLFSIPGTMAETATQAIDTTGVLVDYFGIIDGYDVVSQLGQQFDRGNISAGQFYGNLGLTVVTVGLYDEGMPT